MQNRKRKQEMLWVFNKVLKRTIRIHPESYVHNEINIHGGPIVGTPK